MSLEMIKQNAVSIFEVIDNYDKLVKQQLYLLDRHESNDRLNELNEKILQLKIYFLKLITNIDTLVKQEENLLGKASPKI